MYCSGRPTTLGGNEPKNMPASRASSSAPQRSPSMANAVDGATANFWDIGTYKRCLKRIDDGGLLVDDFKSMVQERAQIERKYAGMLKDWQKKWEVKLEKGPENKESTLYTAWQDIIGEANTSSNTHAEMDTKLSDLTNQHVATWRKANFAKGIMGKHKAVKKAEEGFEKAQKNFAKLRAKFDKNYKTYMQAIETVEGLKQKLTESQLSHEEEYKLREKAQKMAMARDRHQFKCKQRLQRLKEDVPRYQKGMRETFAQCQDVEMKRIEFIKHTLDLYVHALAPGISPSSVEHAKAAYEAIDSSQDVKQYGEKYGDGMPLVLPTVAEPEASSASHVGDAVSHSTPIEHLTGSKASNGGGHTKTVDLSLDEIDIEGPSDDESNDDEWESATIPPPPESKRPMMIALYDYDAEDKEELSFMASDVITQLEPEDAKGWAKGMLANGNVGFYPAHYVSVQVVESTM